MFQTKLEDNTNYISILIIYHTEVKMFCPCLCVTSGNNVVIRRLYWAGCNKKAVTTVKRIIVVLQMELHLAFLWIYDQHQQLSFHSYVKQSGGHVTCQIISARQYTVRKGQNSWQVKRATQKWSGSGSLVNLLHIMDIRSITGISSQRTSGEYYSGWRGGVGVAL